MRKGSISPNRMQVCVRGTVYKDIETAAKALKVKPATVYAAVWRGTTDTLGKGKGRHQVHNISRSTPIEVGGRHFKSMSELSRAMGYNDHYFKKTVKDYGMEQALERANFVLLRRQLELDARKMRDAIKRMDRKLSTDIEKHHLRGVTK